MYFIQYIITYVVQVCKDIKNVLYYKKRTLFKKSCKTGDENAWGIYRQLSLLTKVLRLARQSDKPEKHSA